ncbi:hypothetical protein RHSIM_Rhsim05G0086600 [Rhododendron simsii]|uniref:Uncharacterized protein n=1 Tax=Rhododendron simsii TaxID=118357 RepID=A0A834GWM3_RHOSS|nr:hypothetical protein RHSIM_Rhsim05G0086600 [Rhododendron simsii]
MASRLLVNGAGNALLMASQDQGWPRHDSRRAKTRGGQGKAQGKAITRVGSRVAGGGGLPPLGKPRPPDAGCQGTLLSRPLGQFLAIWPRLLEKTLPVGNARKKDQNAPESKCYLKPSRKAKNGSIGQSKTLSGNSWPFGLGYPRKQIPSVMLRKTTEIPKKTRPVGNARKEHRKALEMACYYDRVWQGETRFSSPFGLGYANRYRPPPSHPSVSMCHQCHSAKVPPCDAPARLGL